MPSSVQDRDVSADRLSPMLAAVLPANRFYARKFAGVDTPESWQWMLGCWRHKFNFMRLGPGERFFFPFSFGPFLGFWTGFEAAARAGYLCLPGGGMSTAARLRFLLEHRATVVCATPTYALHLADVAQQE